MTPQGEQKLDENSSALGIRDNWAPHTHVDNGKPH